MRLDSTLLREFAKITNDTPEKKRESTAYGTFHVQGGKYYVQLDGSDIYTPVEMAMDAVEGDRVVVMIKNHQAIITGNITSPASARKNTYIKTIDDILLLYGLDAVGIRSDTQVGDDIYRAEVVVNTETEDDPVVQLQVYKNDDPSTAKVIRLSYSNGVSGTGLLTISDYYKYGVADISVKLSSNTGRLFTATLTNMPSGYQIAGVFGVWPYPTNHNISIDAIAWETPNKIKVSIWNADSSTVTVTLKVPWFALKLLSSSDTGDEIIVIPDE